MRVLLDSNILWSALITPSGPPEKIYQAWRDSRFTLVTRQEQIDEIRAASRYPKFRAILRSNQIGSMINHLHRAEVWDSSLPRIHQAEDPLDNYLLDLTEAASIHYLVTGDKRAQILQRKNVGTASIVTASSFCQDVLKL